MVYIDDAAGANIDQQVIVITPDITQIIARCGSSGGNVIVHMITLAIILRA
jgi:hypothetical protein